MSNVAVEVSPSVVVKGMRPLSAQPRRRQSFGQLAPVPEVHPFLPGLSFSTDPQTPPPSLWQNRSLLARNIERHQQQRLSRRSQTGNLVALPENGVNGRHYLLGKYTGLNGSAVATSAGARRVQIMRAVAIK
jgi:hypothetical protein